MSIFLQILIILGRSSAVYILSKYIMDAGIDPGNLRIKAVLTSSDMLLPYQRSLIESVFDCRVFDFYGQNENTATAVE